MKGCGVMPKEKINQPRTSRTMGSTDDGVPPPVSTGVRSEDAIVQVGWNAAGWVQVSIEADVTLFVFAADNPDAESNTSDSQRSTVYTPPLDRYEINKLIRVLRRARDAAYGRDE